MRCALSVAAAAAVFASTALFGPASAADEPVDVELVLAVDVSGSMDRDEQVFQRNGYVEACARRRCWTRSGQGCSGASPSLSRMGGAGQQRHAVGLDGDLRPADGGGLRGGGARRADRVDAGHVDLQRPAERGAAVRGQRLRRLPAGDRRLRDGPNNQGPPLASTRDQVLALGIVINGLRSRCGRGVSRPTRRRSSTPTTGIAVIADRAPFVVPSRAKANSRRRSGGSWCWRIATRGKGRNLRDPVRTSAIAAGVRCDLPAKRKLGCDNRDMPGWNTSSRV